MQTKHLYNKKKFKVILFSKKAITKLKSKLKKTYLTQTPYTTAAINCLIEKET